MAWQHNCIILIENCCFLSKFIVYPSLFLFVYVFCTMSQSHRFFVSQLIIFIFLFYFMSPYSRHKLVCHRHQKTTHMYSSTIIGTTRWRQLYRKKILQKTTWIVSRTITWIVSRTITWIASRTITWILSRTITYSHLLSRFLILKRVQFKIFK